MTRAEAAEVVFMLFAAYPTAKPDERTFRIYGELLLDVDAKTARAATHRLIATSRFVPTISELRAACHAQTHGAARQGEEAYALLMQAVRKFGRYRKPRITDPIMARCIGLWGSWEDLCSAPADDPAGRARFIELYETLASRQREDVIAGTALPAAPQPSQLGALNTLTTLSRD